MTWNYRVYASKDGSFGIHEVYYDSLGRPEYYTERHAAPYGESLTELRSDLDMMRAALDKPVLSASDFERPGTKKD